MSVHKNPPKPFIFPQLDQFAKEETKMNQEQELIDHPLGEDERRELEDGDDVGEEEELLILPQTTTTPTTPAAVSSSHHHNNEINHRLCSNCGHHKRGSPESFKQSRNKKPSLPGFSKIALPTQDQPLLRRCTSLPISPPNAVQPPPALHDPPRSPPQNLEVRRQETPLSSAGKLPPRAPNLRRTVSDPSPSSCSGGFESPNDKRLRRMRDCIRAMSKWWDEIMPEEEEQHDAPIIKNNSTPGIMENSDEDIEESVSVEQSGEFLIIHFKCPCGKGYQILLSKKNCYYKLM